ncbi:MAG: MBL fold metallo-hydrolase [Chloroflexota bacterium]
MPDESSPNDSIIFLGTAGARFMITTQLLASGGMWLNLNGTQILLDPGPGCIVQATRRKLKPDKLSAIILSHRHLDHSADTNVMVEAMTEGGLKSHGWLFVPADALTPEPVIFSYLKNRLDGVELLKEGKSYTVGNVSFSTPLRHQHSVETYGIIFKTPKYTFSYITDTLYFDELAKRYTGELLIMNIAFVTPRPQSHDGFAQLPVDHLSVPDAEYLIREIKPKVAILTHFGMGMWRAKPWEIAEKLSQDTGIKVIAARDGMKFDLTQLES